MRRADVGVRIRRTVIQVRREHTRIHAIVPVTATKNRTGRVAAKSRHSCKNTSLFGHESKTVFVFL